MKTVSTCYLFILILTLALISNHISVQAGKQDAIYMIQIKFKL